MNHNGLFLDQKDTICAPASHALQIAKEAPASQPYQPPSFFAKARNRRALIWGGISTVLSALGLIGLALFEQYNGMLSELRGDLKHFNETSGEYVKKERLQRCWEQMKENTKEMSKCNLVSEQLERHLKASEGTREEMAKEMQKLRERLAYLEGLAASNPNVVGPAKKPVPNNEPSPKSSSVSAR
jgi:hypothetical protein